MSQLANDVFGRTVNFSTDDVTDMYSVSGGGDTFTLSYPAGTDQALVYQTINSMGSANDAYGRPVAFSTDGVTDTYRVAGLVFSYAHGTNVNVVYLAIAIANNVAIFQQAVSDFVASRYSLETRLNFMAMYFNAQPAIANLPTRAAYLAPLITWQNTVIQYVAAYVTAVRALTDSAVVASTKWDFTALIAADPLVTPMGAIAINS